MKVAIDYDGTWTSFPAEVDTFVQMLRKKHFVYIVTMRYPTESIPREIADRVDKVIYTSRKAKLPYCRDELKETFDLWLDDNPHWILEDSS